MRFHKAEIAFFVFMLLLIAAGGALYMGLLALTSQAGGVGNPVM